MTGPDRNTSGWIGTDESGKGDYFGPLVVAGVYLDHQTAQEMEHLKVRDSKRISDKRVKGLAAEIRCRCKYSLVVIGPRRYNRLYGKMNNLNRLLAWGHARAIENLLAEVDCSRAISDRFGDERVIRRALLQKGREIELEQRPKAEDDLAVAAASILARAEFMHWLDELSCQVGINLPKGATHVVEVGKQLVEKYGEEILSEVAKLHFKITRKILAKGPISGKGLPLELLFYGSA